MTLSTVSATVTGTITLALSSANGYEIDADGLGPGPRTYRRETAQSPFVRGRFLIDTQLDTMQAPVTIWVGGSTASQLNTRVAALLAAFDQLSYQLDVVIDGVTYSWLCEPADSTVGTGGVFDFWELGAFQQTVSLVIPRDPLPVAGSV